MLSRRHANNCPIDIHCQHGAAFIVMLVILIMGVTAFLVSSLNSSALQIKRDEVTADALAQAKEALIGYAVNVQISNSNLCGSNCPRPGDLPCPDTNDDGVQENSCGNALGTTGQSARLGRLPWKTLGLPDLRDGNGERLWYAVSNNFKYNTRTSCSAAGQAACLNSDSTGTISVYSSNGTLLNDGGAAGSGVAAIIIAPGAPINRSDIGMQNRSGAGLNVANNYLDIANIGGVNHDNSAFIDGSSTDGFIQGRVNDNNGNLVINDQLLTITPDNIMQGVQKRVAAEVRLCLEDYALNNLNRYPWAAPITDLGSTYNDSSNVFFGRIADDLSVTNSDSSNLMSDQWGTCNTHFNNTPAGWWLNWKEMVFYGVSRKFRPKNTLPSALTTNFLHINNPGTPAKFVVIIAGRMLSNPDQSLRSANKSIASYYLEGGNEGADQTGLYTYTQSATSANFNDILIFR